MLDKLNKHAEILGRRLNLNAELDRASKLSNPMLDAIIQAFKSTKNKTHSQDFIEAFERCETYRASLLLNDQEINYKIFSSDRTSRVKDIVAKAASPENWCRFVFEITAKSKAQSVLEIGTNLGVSGSYILEAIKRQKEFHFTTMEGLKQLCEISQEQFEKICPADKFDIVQGLYENTFSKVSQQDQVYDLLFIDGNHQYEPTMAYFEALKKNIKGAAIFIFDDINWNDGMKEAWKNIASDEQVNYCIDMYKQGIVVIDENAAEKNLHFKLHLSY